MTNAIIYTRFSPHRNRNKESESCDTQEALCRTLAKVENLFVKQVVHDPDISGKDEYRENLWLAINAMEKGDVLLVYKRDRLARNVYLSEQINRSVKKKGGRILAVAGDIEGDGPEQEMIRQVLAAISEYERKLISMRTSHAMRHHMRNGRRMSSKCPYGWKQDPDDDARMVANDEELDAIDRVLELYAENKSYRKTAEAMNDEMPDLSRSKSWTHRTIGRIMRRERENGNSINSSTATVTVSEPEQASVVEGWTDEEGSSSEEL
jgi:site-specific DNA recombinase